MHLIGHAVEEAQQESNQQVPISQGILPGEGTGDQKSQYSKIEHMPQRTQQEKQALPEDPGIPGEADDEARQHIRRVGMRRRAKDLRHPEDDREKAEKGRFHNLAEKKLS